MNVVTSIYGFGKNKKKLKTKKFEFCCMPWGYVVVGLLALAFLLLGCQSSSSEIRAAAAERLEECHKLKLSPIPAYISGCNEGIEGWELISLEPLMDSLPVHAASVLSSHIYEAKSTDGILDSIKFLPDPVWVKPHSHWATPEGGEVYLMVSTQPYVRKDESIYTLVVTMEGNSQVWFLDEPHLALPK